MEQLGERLNATRRALDTLAEALQIPFSELMNDLWGRLQSRLRAR